MAANKKINVQVQLDITADKMGIDKIREQINTAISAVKINLDPKSAAKLEQDLNKLMRIAENSINKTTGKLNVKSMAGRIINDADLATVETLSTKLKAAGVDGTKSFNDISNANNYLKTSLMESNSLLAKMGTTLMNTIRWNISASIINKTTQEFQKMYFFAKDLDRSLTNIRIVSGLSADNMGRFAQRANEASKELKVSTLDYTDAALIFYQQGLKSIEVQNMTKAAIIGGNITGQSTEEMSNLLTSVLNGYKIATEDVLMVTDKLAAVGATTAADFYELATAMSKVASMANAAGVPLDQLNAQIATIVSVTKEAPESIGMSLKTIYGRMLMFKNNATGLMKDEDGELFGAPSVEKALEAYSRASGAQISLFKTTEDGKRELRDLGEVIEEIGGSWEGTTDKIAKFGLTTALAGSRQQNRLIALFDAWDMYKGAVETSLQSEGTSLRQNALYMESYEGRLKGLQAAKEEMYMTLMDSDGLKSFISGLTIVVENFTTLLDKAGGFNLLLGIALASLTKMATMKAFNIVPQAVSMNPLSKTTSTKKTSGPSQEVIEARKLADIKRAYGAEEADRMRKELLGSREILAEGKLHQDLLWKELALREDIQSKIMTNINEGTQQKKIDVIIEKNAELEISAETLQRLIDQTRLYKAELENLKNLKAQAAEGPVSDALRLEIESASATTLALKTAINDANNEIAEEASKMDSVNKFNAEQANKANLSLDKTAQQAQKINTTVAALRTGFMMLPSVIGTATDETKSFGDLLSSIGTTAVPAIGMALSQVVSTLMAAKAAGGAFTLSMLAPLAPVLAVVAAVAAIGLAFKSVSDNIITAEKSLKKLEQTTEDYNQIDSEHAAAVRDMIDIDQQIKDTRSEIVITNDSEKLALLNEELETLKKQKETTEETLVIKELMLENARVLNEEAAKESAAALTTSKYYTEKVWGINVKQKVNTKDELGYASDEYKRAGDEVKKYELELAKLQSTQDYSITKETELKNKIAEQTEKRDEAREHMSLLVVSLQDVIKGLETEDGANQELIDSFQAVIDQTIKLSKETLGLNDSVESNEMQEYAEMMDAVAIAMEKVTKQYEESTTKLKEYNGFLDEMNSKEGLSAASKDTLRTKYQQFLPVMEDEMELRQAMIAEIKMEEDARKQSYREMYLNSAEYYSSLVNDQSSYVNEMGRLYDIDLSNAGTLANAKLLLETKLINSLAGLWGEYFGAIMRGTNSSKAMLDELKVEKGHGSKELEDAIVGASKMATNIKKLEDLANKSLDPVGSGSTTSKGKGGSAEQQKMLDALDAQIRAIKIKNDGIIKTGELLQKELKAAKELDGIEGLSEEYRVMEKIILNNVEALESFKQEQQLIHDMAVTIRAQNKQYDTTTWFDANAEQTEAYIDKYNKSTAKQKEEMEVLFSKIQRLKLAWMESATEIEKISDLNQGLIEDNEKLLAQRKELARTNWIKEQNELYQKQQEKLSALDQIQERIIAIIRKRGEVESEELEKAHNAEMESLEERHNARKQGYADELSKFKELVQGKIDALEDQYSEEDYFEKLKEEREKATEIQKNIDVLSLDTSLTARKKVSELKKELTEQNAVILKMQKERERELIKDSLQTQIEEFEESTKEKEKIADDFYEEEKSRLEEDYEINKRYLEKKYSDEKVYAEARKAILDGEVEVAKGRFVELEDAFRDFEDEFGKGMGILGDIIKDDFSARLKEAQELIKETNELTNGLLDKDDLNPPYEDDEEVEEDKKEEPKTGKLSSMSKSDYNKYVNYKSIWEMAKKAGNQVAMDSASQGASALRAKYGISSDEYSYNDLKNLSYEDMKSKGYANGGKITETGNIIAPFHGTKDSPEWIFNDKQLGSLLENVVVNSFDFSAPKMANAIHSDNGEKYNIYFDVQGNMDSSLLPEIQQMISSTIREVEFENVKNQNKLGNFRKIK